MSESSYCLKHIDIEVNHRCNLACRHCSATATKGRTSDELTVDEIKEILASAMPLGLEKVGLTGGEPLFDVPKLKSIAEYCLEELGIPVHIHTNGTLVKNNYCIGCGLLSLFEAVSVTFLGGNAATHDYMTKSKGSFEKALIGVEMCARAGLPLTCYFIPTHGTCGGFKELAKQLKGLGVNRIRAMALAPSGRARPIYGKTAALPDEMKEFEKDLLEIRSELGIHMEAGYCTRLSMPRLAVLAGHDDCMSGRNRVHINSKGDVFPCTAASGVRELNLGNLKKNGFDLLDIWQNSEIINCVRRIHEGNEPQCKACAREPRCQFSCIVNACGTMSEDERKRCPLLRKQYRSKVNVQCKEQRFSNLEPLYLE